MTTPRLLTLLRMKTTSAALTVMSAVVLALLPLTVPVASLAQGALPPVIGDSLWTFTWRANADEPPLSPPYGSGPSLAVAEDAGLLFRSVRDGIQVFNAETGVVVDRIYLDSLVSTQNKDLLYYPRRVACSRDGRRLVLSYRTRSSSSPPDSIKTMLISYPDKRVMRMYPGAVEYKHYLFIPSQISPDGRWASVPIKPDSSGEPVWWLHDVEADTLHFLATPGRWWSSTLLSGCFSLSSRRLVYTERSVAYDTCFLGIIDITPAGLQRRTYPSDVYNLVISGDGRYAMGTAEKDGYDSLGRFGTVTTLKIIDLDNGAVLRSFRGRFDRGELYGGRQRYEMKCYGFNEDASVFFINRNDPEVLDSALCTGQFYRLRDSLPFAIVPTRTIGGQSITTHYNGWTAMNASLTRWYLEPESPGHVKIPGNVVAMRTDEIRTLGVDNSSNHSGRSTWPLARYLYPNPSQSWVDVPIVASTGTSAGTSAGQYSWSLTNSSGAEVASGNSESHASASLRIELPTTLAAGQYILHLTAAATSFILIRQ